MTGTAQITETVANLLRRIDTCLIYVNRRAIVSHNTVVVSTMPGCNFRGVYQGEQPETKQPVMCLGPFPNQMPTCYTSRDAATLVREWNEQAAEHNGETVQLMTGDRWCQNALLEARKTLEVFRDIDPATVAQVEANHNARAA